jgi:ABC-type transport system involved in multi-copper enzyme maturation permease subunit
MKSEIGFQLWAFALNVWREAVRDRLIQILTVFGIILMTFSLILGRMSVGGQARVLVNTGLWIIGVWGIWIVIYLGSNMVRRELLRKTVYLVLSRPVSRPVFLLGKFMGMCLVMVTTFGLLSAAWLVLLKLKSVPISHLHFLTLLFILGEWILLASFSLFFASFTTPLLHNFFLVGMAFLGHWSNDIRIFAENVELSLLKNVLKTLYYILPNLEALNFREAALYGRAISSGLLLEGAAVLFAWSVSALLVANLIFLRRKLI